MRYIQVMLTVCLYAMSLIADASIVSNEKTELQKKLELIENLANSGDSKAQLFLAAAYLEGGEGITINTEKGFRFLEMAAASGDTKLQIWAGEVFHYGQYAKPDLQKAFYWYQQSALNNNAEAMDYLGIFHFGGLGGAEQDCGKAIDWYEKAIKGGYTASRGNLVWTYSTCPDEKYRDGERALKLALQIIEEEGERIESDIDNLAAAYAELDQFDLAIKTQIEAISLLKPEDETRKKKFEARLEMYRHHKKWRGLSYFLPEKKEK